MRNNIKTKSTLFRCIVPTGWFCSRYLPHNPNNRFEKLTSKSSGGCIAPGVCYYWGCIGLLQSIHKMRTKRGSRYFRSEHSLPLPGLCQRHGMFLKTWCRKFLSIDSSTEKHRVQPKTHWKKCGFQQKLVRKMCKDTKLAGISTHTQC